MENIVLKYYLLGYVIHLTASLYSAVSAVGYASK